MQNAVLLIADHHALVKLLNKYNEISLTSFVCFGSHIFGLAATYTKSGEAGTSI
jgi:hypothetical protein